MLTNVNNLLLLHATIHAKYVQLYSPYRQSQTLNNYREKAKKEKYKQISSKLRISNFTRQIITSMTLFCPCL